jgi:hypothetical protein
MPLVTMDGCDSQEKHKYRKTSILCNTYKQIGGIE